MLRAIVGVLGAVAALVPERTIERFERVALEEPGARHLEPRARTAVRAEGILAAGASLLGGATFAGLMKLTGAFGAVLLLFPRRINGLRPDSCTATRRPSSGTTRSPTASDSSGCSTCCWPRERSEGVGRTIGGKRTANPSKNEHEVVVAIR